MALLLVTTDEAGVPLEEVANVPMNVPAEETDELEIGVEDEDLLDAPEDGTFETVEVSVLDVTEAGPFDVLEVGTLDTLGVAAVDALEDTILETLDVGTLEVEYDELTDVIAWLELGPTLKELVMPSAELVVEELVMIEPDEDAVLVLAPLIVVLVLLLLGVVSTVDEVGVVALVELVAVELETMEPDVDVELVADPLAAVLMLDEGEAELDVVAADVEGTAGLEKLLTELINEFREELAAEVPWVLVAVLGGELGLEAVLLLIAEVTLAGTVEVELAAKPEVLVELTAGGELGAAL